MRVLMVLSLDARGCLGDSQRELAGEDPQEKRWFRSWLESRLERGAVILGRRTYEAMGRYALRLQARFPDTPWTVVSRRGPDLPQALAAVPPDRHALLLGGLEVFRQALRHQLADEIWIARLRNPRDGDLVLDQDLSGYRLVHCQPYSTFEVELYLRRTDR